MVVPRGTPNTPNLEIDIVEIKQLEARIAEVAMVNPHKAPELLSTFNKACLDIGEYVTLLEGELLTVKRLLERREAVLLTDIVPTQLEQKNLKDCDTNRKALIVLDNEWSQLQVRQDSIKTAIALLKTKYDGFEMAYMSVRKLTGSEQNQNFLNNSNLSGDTGTTPVGAAALVSRFGSPRY
jgi:hypothetical protein